MKNAVQKNRLLNDQPLLKVLKKEEYPMNQNGQPFLYLARAL